MFIVKDQTKELRSSVNTLQDYTDKINNAISDIKRSYCFIGGLLNEINAFETYKELGYESIVEYCEATFGFKKTFTYDLMKVQNKFNNGTIFSLDKKYENYEFSKLVVMASMNDFQIARCKPDMTVKELKDIKKNKNTLSARAESENKIPVHISNQIDYSKNEITLTMYLSDLEEIIECIKLCKQDNDDEIEYRKANNIAIEEFSMINEKYNKLLAFLRYNLENEKRSSE